MAGMTNSEPIIHDSVEPTLTMPQYAARVGKSVRTVQRWLDQGEILDAVKIDGMWRFPSDAKRRPLQIETQDGETKALAVIAKATLRDAEPSRALNREPGWVGLDQAALYLGVSAYAIRHRPDLFHAEPIGPHGALMVSRRTIAHYLGLTNDGVSA
jgi:hypothetical protein